MICRACGSRKLDNFLDLGTSPPANAYIHAHDLDKGEVYFPLRVKVCTDCWYAQTENFHRPEELFTSDYSYFSSTSTTWLEHAKNFSKYIISKLSLNNESFVYEVASNDGYLLRNFVDANIPCCGIEPTAEVAKAAKNQGINVIQEFLTLKLAKKIKATNQLADLIIANNVLAHVPDIVDFIKSIGLLLKKNGVATFEFHHLLNLLKYKQFDTIYHEHYSYLSLIALEPIFKRYGLYIWDVEKLNTHGGSLRIFVSKNSASFPVCCSVKRVIEEETNFGLSSIETYLAFGDSITNLKHEVLKFLISLRHKGSLVMAYGAAAKGNTLLNFFGIKSDLIAYVFDEAKAKQGKFLPGSRIEIKDPREMARFKPDYLCIFPWNLRDEITNKYSFATDWGCRFVTFIPNLEILDEVRNGRE